MTNAFVKQKVWHAHGCLHELTKNHMLYFLKLFDNICKMTFGYGGSASCSGMEFSQKFETVFLASPSPSLQAPARLCFSLSFFCPHLHGPRPAASAASAATAASTNSARWSSFAHVPRTIRGSNRTEGKRSDRHECETVFCGGANSSPDSWHDGRSPPFISPL